MEQKKAPDMTGAVTSVSACPAGMHIDLMIGSIYGKAAFIDQTVGAGMAALGQGYGSRIAQQQTVLYICCRNMGVAAENKRAFSQRRQMIG